jgi:hypothetical protein
MRIMIKFSLPTAAANEAIKSGKLAETLQRLLQELKPEAGYFYPEGGHRGGILIVNANDSRDVLRLAEPLWIAAGAEVSLTPVMGLDDMEGAFSELPGIVERFG